MTQQSFLSNLDNFSNHRMLLWEALRLTEGTVVEFGSGFGSTPYLRQYCEENDRCFLSYDSDSDWANKTVALHVSDWNSLNIQDIDVLFLDHAPGERRQYDLVKYKDVAQIIVIHDSEPTGGGDYRVRQHFDKFKYCVEVHSDGAWSSMLSNFIDLSGLVGRELEGYKISERE